MANNYLEYMIMPVFNMGRDINHLCVLCFNLIPCTMLMGTVKSF